MLLVIFGAGASYDSVPHIPPRLPPIPPHQDRPPLANELFADRPGFTEVMQTFPACQPVIPFLRHIPQGGSVEGALENLQSEGEQYPQARRQVAAIRYYLLYMLHECEQRWSVPAAGITNYKTLINRIDRWLKPTEQVFLVTFNYDTLLDSVLPTVGVRIGRIQDYITHPRYKLVKLHGSVNWAHRIEAPLSGLIEQHPPDPIQLAQKLIERVADLDINPGFEMVTLPASGPKRFAESYYFPAIAIPVQKKRDYECPSEHLDALRDFIPKAKKLLVIGWRAMESHFLDLLRGEPPLRGGLLPGLKTLVVAGTDQGAKAVAATLVEPIGVKADVFPGGFTRFIVEREVDNFLSS